MDTSELLELKVIKSDEIFDNVVLPDKISTSLKTLVGLTDKYNIYELLIDRPINYNFFTPFRRIIFGLIFILSIPYPYWISLVPNLISIEGGTSYDNSHMIFKIMMTIINCSPFLTYIVYLFVILRYENNLYHSKLKIFKLTNNSPNLPDCANINTNLLRNIIDYAERLQSIDLDSFKLQIAYKKKIFAIVISIWTLVSVIMYTTWISKKVFPEVCNYEYSNVCGIFILLILTSPVKFSFPIYVLIIFLLKYEVMNFNNKIWYQSHKQSNISVAHMSKMLGSNIHLMKVNAKIWQWIFLPMFILPTLSMILTFISSFFNPTIVNVVDNEWAFWIYCVHYSIIAIVTLIHAGMINIDKYKQKISKMILTGESQFADSIDWISKYEEFIDICRNSFKIFGISLTTSTLTSFIILLLGAISYLIDYVV